jgi:ABC-type uncharacterized transport system substrate-binding protein
MARYLFLLLLLLAAATDWPQPAGAHPHAWIDMRTAVIFDDQGRMAALRVHWLFDEFYTEFAIEGLDEDGDGQPDPANLVELAKLNVTNLKEYQYFTDLTADGVQVAYADATDYETFMVGNRLTLTFTIPLAEPVDPRVKQLTYAVYDPTYWIEVLHVREKPVLFEGPVPDGCRYGIDEPHPDADAVGLAATLDQTQSAGDGLGVMFAEQVAILCE